MHISCRYALLPFLLLCNSISAQNDSSTADLTSAYLTANHSDANVAASLTQNDAENAVRPPRTGHAEYYPDYTLRYDHFSQPQVPVERAQAFLMYCNVLFTQKILRIAFQEKKQTVPIPQWPFLCTSSSQQFSDLNLELWPSSRGTASTVPLNYITSLIYHMYNFDELWEVEDPYLSKNGGDNTTGVGAGAGRGGFYSRVPYFEVELSQRDGPGHVFALFKRPGGLGGSGNGSEGDTTYSGSLGTRPGGGTITEYATS